MPRAPPSAAVSLTSPTQAEAVPVPKGRVGAAFDNLLQLNSQAPCRLALVRPEAKCKGREPEAVKNPFQSSSESVISQFKKKMPPAFATPVGGGKWGEFFRL